MLDRYDWKGDGTIYVDGAPDTLLALAKMLRAECACASMPLRSPTKERLEGFGGFLGQIRVIRSQGLIKVHRDNDVLRIEGGSLAMENAARSLASLVRQAVEHRVVGSRVPSHMHWEYFPGNFFFEEDTTPVIIGVTCSAATPKGSP